MQRVSLVFCLSFALSNCVRVYLKAKCARLLVESVINIALGKQN